MRSSRTLSLRKKVAREAALLLCTSQENEFKQAKLHASETLDTHVLPRNLEVALELDCIADEYEGKLRQKRLTQMRSEALEVMSSLRDFNPRLIGSVWRGTAHKNSDIDLVVFSTNPRLVIDHLQEVGFHAAIKEQIAKATGSEVEESLHIHLNLPSGDEAEIVVRDRDEMDRDDTCEIYGDTITGLSLTQLENILKEDPTRRFLPNRLKV